MLLCEVAYDIFVERGAKLAHLRYTRVIDLHKRFQDKTVVVKRKDKASIHKISHLTHVGHFARFVRMFHVVQKERFVLKGPLTDLAHFCRTMKCYKLTLNHLQSNII